MGVVPNDLYTAGTISLTNGSDIVTGDGTFWLAVALRGDTIWVADRSLLVKEVLADDQIKLAAPWGGDTVADLPYALTYSSWLRYDTGELQGGVRDLIAFYRMGGVRGTREVTVPVDAITVDDLGKVVVYDSASAVDASIPEAGAGGKLIDGWACWIKVTGVGDVMLTPAVSTINGETELLLVRGDTAMIWSHGGDYLAAVLHVSEDGDDGATIVAQDDEPDTDLPAGSLWIDANSADLDIYQLIGSPPEWVPLGIALKGSPGTAGADGDDGVDGINGASALTVVRTVAAANVSIASALEAGDAVSGVTLVANDLVLLTAQTAPAENGVYVVSASGAAARHASFATYDSHPGCYFSVCEGTGVADTLWRCTSDRGGTLGTTALAFSQFTAGGDVAGDTHAAVGKSTPVDADELPLVDSAASNVLKRLTWANLKATLASWLVSAGWIRDKLTANRTYYVSTTGSDSNNGLSAGAPFLTIQKAINTVAALDISIYNVTIQLADDTYTAGMQVNGPWIGSGTVTVVGNTSTPANVVISSSGDCVKVLNNGTITISGMRLTTSAGYTLYALGGGSNIWVGSGIIFGSAAQGHMRTDLGSYITLRNAYTISGGGQQHMLTNTNGIIEVSGITVTLSGTPAFSDRFASSLSGGQISIWNVTYSGGATGSRYSVSANAVINTFGQSTSYLPGNAAGSTATGGQYL